MKGDTVIARSFGGIPLMRRVIGSNKEVVYITSEDNFNRLIKGLRGTMPIGFPRRDVFVFDENVFRSLNKNPQQPQEWERLRVWRQSDR